MAYQEITDEEIEAGAPMDNLLLTKMKDNFDYLKLNSGGSSGAGGSLIWETNFYRGAEKVVGLGNIEVIHFPWDVNGADDQSTRATTSVVVPSNYAGGIVPKLNFVFYTEGTSSGNITFNVITKLLRGNATPTQPTASVTQAKTFANNTVVGAIQQEVFDLGTTGGIINTTEILADDVLLVEVTGPKGTPITGLKLIPILTNIQFTE